MAPRSRHFQQGLFARLAGMLLLCSLASVASAQPALPGGKRVAAAPGASAGSGRVPATTAEARAEALFKQGQTELEAGNYDVACGHLAESLRLDRAAGTLINLARCHELQGRTATAYREYREVADLASQAAQQERAKGALELAEALAPKLSRLRIQAPTGLTGLTIKRDGDVVDEGALNQFVPVDPGEHSVSATAPGRSSWATKVRVGAEADQQTVAVPTLDPTPPPEDAGGGPGTLQIAGYVVGGVGVVGLVLGTAFGIVALQDVSAAEDDPALCPDKQCSPEGREAIDSATTKSHVSTVSLAVGGAALVAGVVMAFASGASEPAETAPNPPALRVTPWLGPDVAGLGLSWQHF